MGICLTPAEAELQLCSALGFSQVCAGTWLQLHTPMLCCGLATRCQAWLMSWESTFRAAGSGREFGWTWRIRRPLCLWAWKWEGALCLEQVEQWFCWGAWWIYPSNLFPLKTLGITILKKGYVYIYLMLHDWHTWHISTESDLVNWKELPNEAWGFLFVRLFSLFLPPSLDWWLWPLTISGKLYKAENWSKKNNKLRKQKSERIL